MANIKGIFHNSLF